MKQTMTLTTLALDHSIALFDWALRPDVHLPPLATDVDEDFDCCCCCCWDYCCHCCCYCYYYCYCCSLHCRPSCCRCCYCCCYSPATCHQVRLSHPAQDLAPDLVHRTYDCDSLVHCPADCAEAADPFVHCSCASVAGFVVAVVAVAVVQAVVDHPGRVQGQVQVRDPADCQFDYPWANPLVASS